MSDYLKVEISAETAVQADEILNALLESQLVTGGQIIGAPARFNWKGRVTDMNYFTVTSFTMVKHKAAIIEQVKKVSIEELPMVVFLEIDGNSELLDWIQQTVA